MGSAAVEVLGIHAVLVEQKVRERTASCTWRQLVSVAVGESRRTLETRGSSTVDNTVM